MHQRCLLILAVLITLLLGGHTPSPVQRVDLQRELAPLTGLDALTNRGFTYRFLSNDLIELTLGGVYSLPVD
ncbi:MAG: hypothetical protein AAB393_14700 [Bacteroidota bacterium]